VICIMLVSIKLVWRDRRRAFGATSPPGPTDSDLSSLLLAHAGMDQAASTTVESAGVTATVVEVEMTPVLPWPVMASSPAAIFVVDHTMRVVLWSSGKKTSVLAFSPRLFSRLRLRVPTNSVLSHHLGMCIAAPMSSDPVNRNLSRLPFMEASAGTQLCEHLRWMFEAPDVPSSDGHAIMLHLYSKHGPVLLEMVANVIAQPKRLVIVTGRELNSNLSSLIAQSVASGETPWRGRVAKSQISQTTTDEAYQPSGVSSADEVAIPNYRRTRAPRWSAITTTSAGTADSLVADGSRDDDAASPVTDDSATVWGDCESLTSTHCDDDHSEGMCPLCRIPYRNRRGALECPLCHVAPRHRQGMLNEQVMPALAD